MCAVEPAQRRHVPPDAARFALAAAVVRWHAQQKWKRAGAGVREQWKGACR